MFFLWFSPIIPLKHSFDTLNLGSKLDFQFLSLLPAPCSPPSSVVLSKSDSRIQLLMDASPKKICGCFGRFKAPWPAMVDSGGVQILH